MTEIDRIVRLLEKTFDKQPWYGSSIMEILSRVDSEQSAVRQGNTHSIIELVLHMTSWRKFTTQRLIGNAEFEVTDEANFPKATTWKDALDQLHQSQEALLNALKQFSENRLAELVPSKMLKFSEHQSIWYSFQFLCKPKQVVNQCQRGFPRIYAGETPYFSVM